MKKIISAIIIICIIIIGFIAYKSMAKPTVKANVATLLNNSSSSNTQKTDASNENNTVSSTTTGANSNTGNNSSTNTTTNNAQSQSTTASNVGSGQSTKGSNQEATNSNTTVSNSNSNNSINNNTTSTLSSATNDNNNSNGNITVTNADIQKGLYSNYIFEKSRKISINSKELAQNIFNNLNSNLKAKYNYKYNGLTPEEDNIVLNGSSAQKQKLLDSIGNRLLINISADTQLPSITGVTLNPTNYTNGTYYYSFSINSLKNVCENINSWGKYCGLSTSSGSIMLYQTLNNLVADQEIYTLTNGTPAYPSEYNFTNGSSL